MSEFFANIGAWFSDNQETLQTILTMFTTGGLGAMIVTIVKSISATRANNSLVQTLGQVVKDTTDEGSEKINNTIEQFHTQSATLTDIVNNTAATIVKVTEQVTEKIAPIVDAVENLKKQHDTDEKKLDAMFDMFTVVYSTIRDDDVRAAVMAILNNAKYGSATVKDELQNELASLKQAFAEQINSMRTQLDDTIEKAGKVIEPEYKQEVTEAKESKGVSRAV